MRSKTSFFNRQIFRTALSRFWPLWGAYALVLFVLVPLHLINGSHDSTDLLLSVSYQILSMGWQAGCVVSFVMAAATAMCVFGYLYNQRLTGMMASLPVKRGSMYFSSFLAGFAAMAGIDVLIFLLTLAAEAGAGQVAISYLWQWLAIMVMMNLTFYGFASLCAMLTGNLAVLPLVYAVLEFTVAAVEYLVRNLLSIFVFGMTTNGSTLDFLSPVFKIMSESPGTVTTAEGTITSAYLTPEQWTLLGVYAAVGLVLAAAGLLLYKNRRMEYSTDVVAVKCLKPVFKYCMTFGCALVLGMLFFSIAFSRSQSIGALYFIILFMLCGAFIGYFAADMLMKKTFRVFSGNWRGYIISCLVIAALMFSCRYDVFGYERHIPDADSIQSATVNINGDFITLEDPDNISALVNVQKSIVANKDLHFNASYNGGATVAMHLTYELKNGSFYSRSYSVSAGDGQGADSDILALQDVVNSKEAISCRKATKVAMIPENVSSCAIDYYDSETGQYTTETLTADQAVELYNNCILPDIENGTLGRLWLVTDGTDYSEKVYAAHISINLFDSAAKKDPADYDKNSYDYFETALTTDAVNTLAWLAKNTDIKLVLEKDVPVDQGNYGKTYTESAAVVMPTPTATAAG
jgi:ABC-2 type transport system permease protein